MDFGSLFHLVGGPDTVNFPALIMLVLVITKTSYSLGETVVGIFTEINVLVQFVHSPSTDMPF